MFIRRTENLRGTTGEIKTEAWSSYRLLHAADRMGVTLTDAVLEPGVHRPWWYKNHLEAVYCLEGEGILEDLVTGETHAIEPGTLYALDRHDRHRLTVESRMRVVCTFVPPLVGGELHDADGSYPTTSGGVEPGCGSRVPNVDPELLVALLEYTRWATEKIFDALDRMPPATLSQPVTNSFPTVLATLQHVYGWEKYYFIHLQGEHAERSAISEPATYEQLKAGWAILHREMLTWARANLAGRKDLVLVGWGVWPTWMIVMQLVNHGTHHFGQVVTLLRQLGYVPERGDSIDLVRYLLRRYPQENQKESVRAFLDRDTKPLDTPGEA